MNANFNSFSNGGISFWRNHIIQYKKSNASLKAYCEVFNLDIRLFENWREKILFDKRIIQDSELVDVSYSQNTMNYIDLILPNSSTLRITEGFDPHLLTDIISTLTGELHDN